MVKEQRSERGFSANELLLLSNERQKQPGLFRDSPLTGCALREGEFVALRLFAILVIHTTKHRIPALRTEIAAR